jgi:hypothetical protein
MPITTQLEEKKERRFSKSWLFLALIMLLVIIVRIRLMDFPLERDEGEYAYMGQLILQNFPPYSEAYNMKFPGTYLMYAGIMALFGQTIQGIHIGLMTVNCLTILLVFLLSRKIVSDSAALAASATYAMLSLSPSVLGFAGHATHFVILPALGGILLLLHALRKDMLLLYFFSGVLLGLSFIMKQPGIFFFLFGALYILYHHVSSRLASQPACQPTSLHEKVSSMSFCSLKELFFKLGALSLGAVLPFLVIIVWLYVVGVFDKFWFWTIKYAGKYGAQIPFSDAFPILKDNFLSVVDGFFLLWLISALGFIATFFHDKIKAHRVFIVLFTVFSFLTVCPGFYFREHYFITFLPAAALLAGIFFDYAGSRTSFLKPSHLRFAGAGFLLVAIGIGVFSQKEYFITQSPQTLSRNIYGANPFPESVEIAKFIASRSSINDKIAVFGSEPQIFFYSKRHSATGYIYMYNLMEIHDYALTMQKEMVKEVESSNPKFIVVVPITTSWLIRTNSEKFVLNWIEGYLYRNYSLVGVADIISPDMTVYKWDDDARNYIVRSEANVLIYERR